MGLLNDPGLVSDYTLIGSNVITTPVAQRLTQASTSPNVFLFSVANTQDNYNFMQLAYPTNFKLPTLTTPFTANLQYFDVGFSGYTLTHPSNTLISSAGISLINLDTSHTLNFEVYNTGTAKLARNSGCLWNSPPGYAIQLTDPYWLNDFTHIQNPTWIRVVSDGTTITHYLSNNGLDFVAVGFQGINSSPSTTVSSALSWTGSGNLTIGFEIAAWTTSSIPDYRILGFSVTTP